MADYIVYEAWHSVTGATYIGCHLFNPSCNCYYGTGAQWKKHLIVHGREHVGFRLLHRTPLRETALILESIEISLRRDDPMLMNKAYAGGRLYKEPLGRRGGSNGQLGLTKKASRHKAKLISDTIKTLRA